MAEGGLSVYDQHPCCSCDVVRPDADLPSLEGTLGECKQLPDSQLTPKLSCKDPVLTNGCIKTKMDNNGIIKLTERSGDTDRCCDLTFDTEHLNLNDCSDDCRVNDRIISSSAELQKHTATNEPKDEHVLSSSVDSCSKTESELSDALVSTSISELSGSDSSRDSLHGIEYVIYESEVQMQDIMRLITKDLSEPYSIYTYRYFIHNWPKLCFLAMDGDKCVGAIVCKLDMHKKMVRRGYIAMLAVDQDYRRRKIGSHLVMKAIRGMIEDDCDEVVLETEITNKAALMLYENLGFVRDKRLFRYYLNGVDALRLKLWLR